jgi:hypothetical protein
MAPSSAERTVEAAKKGINNTRPIVVFGNLMNPLLSGKKKVCGELL